MCKLYYTMIYVLIMGINNGRSVLAALVSGSSDMDDVMVELCSRALDVFMFLFEDKSIYSLLY